MGIIMGSTTINGSGYGSGYGDGDGYGYGSGYGYGDGYGDGYGYGYGYGSGSGDGYGYGYGYGSDIESYWSASIKTIVPKNKISDLKKIGCLLAYWRSTHEGKPANGGNGTIAKVGLIEEIQGPLEICTKRALHATLNPPKWKGEKLWIVALYPPFIKQDDKIGSLKREFICEAGFSI